MNSRRASTRPARGPAAARLAAGVWVLALLACLPAWRAEAAPERGHDPWVFRSVLDGRPRMLTLALRPELWVAYDTSAGALHRFWRGEVVFDGAVYNRVHGTQPASQGQVLFGGGDPEPWSLQGDGGAQRLLTRYRGHELRGARAWLHYELRDGERVVARVEESPEVVGAADALSLERRFRVSGLAPGARLALALPAARPGVVLAAIGARLEAGEGTQTLVFAGDGVAALDARFDEAALARGVAVTAAPEPLDDAAKVERLWQQHGCQSCHARDAKITGPAFSDIALRYPWTDAVREELAWRVARGGSGRFGEVAMPPQPGLSEALRLELVDSILALDGEEPPAGAGSGPSLGQWLRRAITKRMMALFSAMYSASAAIDAVRAEGPGDGARLDGVHPSFRLEPARPAGFDPRVGGLAFHPDGRLLVSTWDAEGAVHALDVVRADAPSQMRATRIASGLAEPLGLAVLGERIFVLQKHELTELVDRDGDGITDAYVAVSTDWDVTANFHEFAFGLAEREGRLLATLATAVLPGGKSSPTQVADRGSVIEIDPATGRARRVAHGLRTPNGIGFGPGGRLFVSDNEGDWLPSSKLLLLEEGAFYGSRAVDFAGTEGLAVTPPVVWLPQNEIGNSPTQMVPLSLGPYRDQLLLGDVTHGGLKRVVLDEVDGRLQGAVLRFSQGFEAGINRLAWGPDGKLYVGGIGSTGNWFTPGHGFEGLQRFVFTGERTFEMLALEARNTGLEIVLTEPLADGVSPAPADVRVEQWRYEPTAEYGGPKVDHTTLAVRTIAVGPERRRLFVAAEGLAPGHVVYVRLAPDVFASRRGARLWSPEAWYTLNRVPTDRPGASFEAAAVPGSP